MPFAIPYSRFSSDKQSKGDSTKRQSREFLEFCARHDLTPWDGFSINDDGQTAWKGKNARGKTQFADFLALVVAGKFPRGTVLVVENQDRISRDQVNNTLKLFNTIVENGVWVGDALANTIVKEDDLNDPMCLLRIVMGAQRAYDYSVSLSRRLRSAWRGKRERAVASKEILCKTGPQWLKLSDDRKSWIEIPERVEVIRAIFKMAEEGVSLTQMARTLHAQGMMTAKGKLWMPSNISKVIRSRAVLGEFQPHEWLEAGIKASGDPVLYYFPPIVATETFDKANMLLLEKGISRRGREPNKRENENLFRGILFDQATGRPMHIKYSYGRNKTNIRKKLSADYLEDVTPSVDYEKFLKAFLRSVTELDPGDFVEGSVRDELVTLLAKQASIDAKLVKVEKRIKQEDEIDYLLDTKRELSRQREGVLKEIDGLSYKLRNPIAETVKDAQALIKSSATIRRSMMRLMVSRIETTIHHQGFYRHCQVWVMFRTGRARVYTFQYRATKGMSQLDGDGGEGYWLSPLNLVGKITTEDGRRAIEIDPSVPQHYPIGQSQEKGNQDSED